MGAATAARRAAPKKEAAALAAAITISTPALAKGEVYIGALLGADGSGHHVVLLAGDKSGTWQSMMEWAKGAGGDLPNRIEQAMLFAEHADKFKKDFYWSNTQPAGDPVYAWLQTFGNGYQYYWRKDGSCRARAVRRIPIR